MNTTPEAHRRPHVILAEDNADLRSILAEVLGELGTDVEVVADGGRFLVCIASQYDEGRTPSEVDLIITDISMPVCSGFDVLTALRAAGWKTPTIIMTGLVTEPVRARAQKLGATLLGKPLDLATFQSTVASLLLARPPESVRGPSSAGSRFVSHGAKN